MYFTSKNIEVRFIEFDQLRRFIQESLKQVKAGEISKDEFVEAIESCFHSASPLSWDDCLILRATTRS